MNSDKIDRDVALKMLDKILDTISDNLKTKKRNDDEMTTDIIKVITEEINEAEKDNNK